MSSVAKYGEWQMERQDRGHPVAQAPPVQPGFQGPHIFVRRIESFTDDDKRKLSRTANRIVCAAITVMGLVLTIGFVIIVIAVIHHGSV